MQLVVFHLLGSAAVRLVDGLLHRLRDGVRIHNNQAVHISRRSSRGLGKCPSTAQETFFVSIQNRHQRHRRNVQSLPQKVHSHQHVEQSVLEILDDFHPFHSVHIRVYVTAANSHIGEILLQFLGHSLGECCHQHPLVRLCPHPDFFQQVIHLILGRPDLNGRVKQPRRTHNLLYHKPFRLLKFIVRRSSAHIDRLSAQRLELVKLKRPVVSRSRQPEAIVNQHRLAGVVSSVHSPDLRYGHVALVNEGDIVLREIVNQAERSHPFAAPVEIARIVLDSGTIAHFLNHLQVVFHPLFQPLGFQALAEFQQLVVPRHKVILNHTDGFGGPLFGGHEIVGRVDGNLVYVLQCGTRHRVDGTYSVHFVSEEFNPDSIFPIAYAHIHRVSAHPESAPFEIRLRA